MAAVKPPVRRTSSANHRSTRRAAPTRTVRRQNPAIGTALRAAVDDALGRLPDDAPAAAELAPELISTLRVGLARTSATGDTCRLPAEAVSAIRDAIGCLEHADLGPARSALATARGKLPPVVPRQAGPVDP